jgi:hypothetical protein
VVSLCADASSREPRLALGAAVKARALLSISDCTGCANSPQWMVEHPAVLKVVTLLRRDKARVAPDKRPGPCLPLFPISPHFRPVPRPRMSRRSPDPVWGVFGVYASRSLATTMAMPSRTSANPAK